MEKHEENSDTKATSIITKSKAKFLKMGFTRHEVRPGEAKGKASNVSWCVEHLPDHLEELMIP